MYVEITEGKNKYAMNFMLHPEYSKEEVLCDETI
jgi:hypothetical protein